MVLHGAGQVVHELPNCAQLSRIALGQHEAVYHIQRLRLQKPLHTASSMGLGHYRSIKLSLTSAA